MAGESPDRVTSPRSHAQWVKHALEQTKDFDYLPGDVRAAMLALANNVIEAPTCVDHGVGYEGVHGLGCDHAPDPQRRRLVIVVDVDVWRADLERTPEDLGRDLLTSDGEYTLPGALVEARWADGG